MEQSAYLYDAFISHSSQDKVFARELAGALRDAGLARLGGLDGLERLEALILRDRRQKGLHYASARFTGFVGLLATP